VVFEAMPGLSDPIDVFEVAEPVPVAALLLKWVAENYAASCACSVESFGRDGSPQ